VKPVQPAFSGRVDVGRAISLTVRWPREIDYNLAPVCRKPNDHVGETKFSQRTSARAGKFPAGARAPVNSLALVSELLDSACKTNTAAALALLRV